MARDYRVGRNLATTAENGTLTAISSSTAVTLTASGIGLADNRLYLCVKNTGNLDIWIRFKPAATDNTKHGIFLPRGDMFILDSDQMYIGETSVIAESVNIASLSFVEF